MTDTRKDLIHDILYRYIACQSTSDTDGEREAEQFFLDYMTALPYFQEHPENCGAFPVPEDPHKRCVTWAMVQGQGPETIVLLHHHDVVGIEDFKSLKPLAYQPDALREALLSIVEHLPEEAAEDLKKGGWLFGRGGCDMKGGGSIQMALLTEYAAKAESDPFRGNVLVLSVPDEENLSAGMRAGVQLLAQLKRERGLRYLLMVNSEPHQRRTPEKGVFSFGSVGKMMPFVYVRGYLSHAGKVFEGLNPDNIMAEIVRRTELNMDFTDADSDGGITEAAPPPTWLYLKDSKEQYDVSMPAVAMGCLSVLTLKRTPADVLSLLMQLCEKASDTVIEEMNERYRQFLALGGRVSLPGSDGRTLPWKSRVMTFGELYQVASSNHGAEFSGSYHETLDLLKQAVAAGRETLITANFKLIDRMFDYIDDMSPRVVTGFVPPFYPAVSNHRLGNRTQQVAELYDQLCSWTHEFWGQEYEKELFFNGISDLSYSGMHDSAAVRKALKEGMPFWEELYSLPLEDMETITMPCVNIGPWGKDFHKLTERVWEEDLYERTPVILDKLIWEWIG